jgi:hypothetical protein
VASRGDERVNRRSRPEVRLEAPEEQAQLFLRKVVQEVPRENEIEVRAGLRADELREHVRTRRREIRDREPRASPEEELEIRRSRGTEIENGIRFRRRAREWLHELGKRQRALAAGFPTSWSAGLGSLTPL